MTKRRHPEPPPDAFRVTQDGRELYRAATYNACFAWLLRHQSRPAHEALTSGGYAIEARPIRRGRQPHHDL